MWLQTYDPLGNPFLSTARGGPAGRRAAGCDRRLADPHPPGGPARLGVALAVAMFVYRMPVSAALASAGYGAAYGLLPIGWIILNLIFLYQLTVKKGSFERAAGAAWPRLCPTSACS